MAAAAIITVVTIMGVITVMFPLGSGVAAFGVQVIGVPVTGQVIGVAGTGPVIGVAATGGRVGVAITARPHMRMRRSSRSRAYGSKAIWLRPRPHPLRLRTRIRTRSSGGTGA
jgi:hypothetical protein